MKEDKAEKKMETEGKKINQQIFNRILHCIEYLDYLGSFENLGKLFLFRWFIVIKFIKKKWAVLRWSFYRMKKGVQKFRFEAK